MDVVVIVITLITMVAAITATIYTVKIWRFNQESDLEVRVSPTRQGIRQMAQFRLYNRGNRPVHVQSFIVQWGMDGAASARLSIHESLPAILQPKEGVDFLAFIDDRPIEDLTGLGVRDRDNRTWWASDDNLQRFIRVAIQYSPPVEHPAPQPDTAKADENVAIRARLQPCNVDVDLRIEVENLGTEPLALACVEVKWKYDPPRYLGGGEKRPYVEEVGGAIQLGTDSLPAVIQPQECGHCRLSSDMKAVLSSAAAPDVSATDIAIVATSSSGNAWHASGDGVSDVIKSAAFRIATSKHTRGGLFGAVE